LTQWIDTQGFVLGATVSPQTLYDLGADWYRTRLDLDWQPASAAEATATFARHGLIGDFWTLT
jgi:hypothetical protein